MKLASKAALLSAFTFPGAGHFFLKHNVSGFLIVVVYIIILGFLFKGLVSMMEPLIQQIQAGDLLLSVDIMKDILSNSLFSNQQKMTSISYAMALLWLIAIIDAYRLGLRQDANVSNTVNNLNLNKDHD